MRAVQNLDPVIPAQMSFSSPGVANTEQTVGGAVFFYGDLHHMGMYIGDGTIVHAPQTGDVVKIVPLAGRPFAGGVRVA